MITSINARNRSENRRNGSGGRGRNRGGALGPGGYCVCSHCGKKVPHERSIKCTSLKCPECGHTMVREELLKNQS